MAATILPTRCAENPSPTTTVVFLALQVDTQDPKGAAALWAFSLFHEQEPQQNPVY